MFRFFIIHGIIIHLQRYSFCSIIRNIVLNNYKQAQLKPVLKLYRYHNLERDIAPHVKDTSATSNHILIGIFQSAQVVLIGFVQQVISSNIQFGNLLTFHLNIGTCRKTEQSITRRFSLCVIRTIDMRLLQITVKPCCYIQIVKQRAMYCSRCMVMIDSSMRMMKKFPLQIHPNFLELLEI